MENNSVDLVNFPLALSSVFLSFLLLDGWEERRGGNIDWRNKNLPPAGPLLLSSHCRRWMEQTLGLKIENYYNNNFLSLNFWLVSYNVLSSDWFNLTESQHGGGGRPSDVILQLNVLNNFPRKTTKNTDKSLYIYSNIVPRWGFVGYYSRLWQRFPEIERVTKYWACLQQREKVICKEKK